MRITRNYRPLVDPGALVNSGNQSEASSGALDPSEAGIWSQLIWAGPRPGLCVRAARPGRDSHYRPEITGPEHFIHLYLVFSQLNIGNIVVFSLPPLPIPISQPSFWFLEEDFLSAQGKIQSQCYSHIRKGLKAGIGLDWHYKNPKSQTSSYQVSRLSNEDSALKWWLVGIDWVHPLHIGINDKCTYKDTAHVCVHGLNLSLI